MCSQSRWSDFINSGSAAPLFYCPQKRAGSWWATDVHSSYNCRISDSNNNLHLSFFQGCCCRFPTVLVAWNIFSVPRQTRAFEDCAVCMLGAAVHAAWDQILRLLRVARHSVHNDVIIWSRVVWVKECREFPLEERPKIRSWTFSVVKY